MSGELRAAHVLGALVVFDLFLYCLHRIGHGVGWRIHCAHHAPPHFSVAMSFRDSVVHLVVFAAAFVSLEFWLDLSFEEGALVSCVLLVFQVWTHVRAWIPLGPIDWLLIGPRHHCVHHATPMKADLVNLGGLLCFWDQMGGTYRHPPKANPVPPQWPRRSPPRVRHWLGL
ncbi:MAG: sterol desaturase family protein [Myxococcaceae bacterium]